MTIPAELNQIVKTAAAWTAENPILAKDVIGVEVISNNINRFKRGDGATRWNNLSYLDKAPPVSLSEIGGVIPVKNGGTSASTAAGARNNLEITPTNIGLDALTNLEIEELLT